MSSLWHWPEPVLCSSYIQISLIYNDYDLKKLWSSMCSSLELITLKTAKRELGWCLCRTRTRDEQSLRNGSRGWRTHFEERTRWAVKMLKVPMATSRWRCRRKHERSQSSSQSSLNSHYLPSSTALNKSPKLFPWTSFSLGWFDMYSLSRSNN